MVADADGWTVEDGETTAVHGLRAYRKALPLFLGIIVGECVVGSFWTLVGIYLDIPTYAFWP